MHTRSTSFSLFFLFSLSLTPSLGPVAHCSVSSLAPCPLDTSSVKLEQLHLQHKGFPSIPSGFQIKTLCNHYFETLSVYSFSS